MKRGVAISIWWRGPLASCRSQFCFARKWARGRRDARFEWEQPVASSLRVDMEASGLGYPRVY
jgi:hypothetical protein